ncbi:hypothetical protein HDZ31DRAFT_63202 [Schizophyllum fasciatum]
MPATRHNHRAARHAPLGSATGRFDDEIISLSSDDGLMFKNKPKKSGKKKSKPPSNVEIVEISDDEDEKPVQSNGLDGQMQRQIQELKQENSRLKHDCARSAKELTAVRNELKAAEKGKAKATMDSEMDDLLSCEICSMREWTPMLIPSCGHSFCKTCLFDWFNQTYTQHLAANPTYQPSRAQAKLPRNVELILGAISPFELQHVRQLIAIHAQPAPKYTCPACRQEVTARPTEVFQLKKIIHKIAGESGEKEPAKVGPPQPMGRSRRGVLVPLGVEDPWAKFFP